MRIAVGFTLAIILLCTVGMPSARPASAAGIAPQAGVQWHALWADQTDETRKKELDMLAANGVEWVRIDVAWSMIQPKSGSFDLAWGVPFVESVIDQVRARGMKVLVQFWRTPSWANGGKGDTTAPTNSQDYANALGWLVSRLHDKVAAWQVWNEPNLNTYFSGASASAYVKLLQPAYKAAHAADPDAVVVFGGTMYVDTDWISQAYAAGARGYFDVMAVHAYQGHADYAPESPDTGDRTRMMHVDVLVDLMAARGDGAKPIWFTEFGWSVHTNTSSTPVWELGVTEAQQADFFIRTLALAQARWPQVKVVFWYNSRDKNTGAIHTDSRGLMKRDFTPRQVLSKFNRGEATVPIASGSTWKFRDDGVDSGTAWRGPDFDDSAWGSGNAVLGYGQGEATTLSGSKAGYAFRKSFNVIDKANYKSLNFKAQRDDGIVVWLNGTEVWRDNMPSGEISMNTTAATCVSGLAEASWRTVTVPTTALRTGRNVVAVSTHNCNTSSSDIRFNLELTRG